MHTHHAPLTTTLGLGDRLNANDGALVVAALAPAVAWVGAYALDSGVPIGMSAAVAVGALGVLAVRGAHPAVVLLALIYIPLAWFVDLWGIIAIEGCFLDCDERDPDVTGGVAMIAATVLAPLIVVAVRVRHRARGRRPDSGGDDDRDPDVRARQDDSATRA